MTSFGCIEYQHLWMEVKNAPSFVQAVMIHLFCDVDYIECFINDFAISTHGPFMNNLHLESRQSWIILVNRKSLWRRTVYRSTHRTCELLFISQNVENLKKDLSDIHTFILTASIYMIRTTRERNWISFEGLRYHVRSWNGNEMKNDYVFITEWTKHWNFAMCHFNGFDWLVVFSCWSLNMLVYADGRIKMIQVDEHSWMKTYTIHMNEWMNLEFSLVTSIGTVWIDFNHRVL